MATTVLEVGAMVVNAAQLVAQYAPVPWLAPAVSMVGTLITMIDQAHANRNALNQLRDRSISFLSIVYDKGERVPDEQKKLVEDAQRTLHSIISLIGVWCSKSRLELFIKQRTLMTVIQDCFQQINDCIGRLQLSFALDTATWQSEFSRRTEKDKGDYIRYLSDISNKLSIIEMAQRLPCDEKIAVMGKMQKMLPTASDPDTRGLGNNLYGIQESTKSLLPSMQLRFQGEIQRIGEPVYRTPLVDVWEGVYLNEKKVAIKMLRTIHTGPQTLKRFEREVEVWKRVWDADQGNHILPLYGYCHDSGSFPYVISPWPENGTADEYVKHFPNTDHLALIRGICAGIRVLHTMTPMVVHGELRGSNVVIDGCGNPLLANFGFSKFMQDAEGAAITHTVGQDFARWMAPELSSDDGSLTTSADIYAFGMTMLELLTHEKPWVTVRASHKVIVKASRGDRPDRPCDPACFARGLDDCLWGIMLRCWDEDDKKRPCATELLQMLGGQV